MFIRDSMNTYATFRDSEFNKASNTFRVADILMDSNLAANLRVKMEVRVIR